MPRPRSWADEQLAAAVAAAGKYDVVRAHIARLGLDASRLPTAGPDSSRKRGDHTDNRLENLRILCPNCHALTGTRCGKGQRPA